MASTQLSWTVTDASSRLFEVLVQIFKAGVKLISRFGTTELSMDLKSGVLTMRGDVEVWRLAIAIASRFIQTDTIPRTENSRTNADHENDLQTTPIATQTHDEIPSSQHVLPNTPAPAESKTLPAPDLPQHKPTMNSADLDAIDNARRHRNFSRQILTEDDLSFRLRTPGEVRDNDLNFASVTCFNTPRGVFAFQHLDAPFRAAMYPNNIRSAKSSRVDEHNLENPADTGRK